MDTGTVQAGEREAHALGGLVAVIVATGLAGSLFPAVKTTIIVAVIALGVLALAGRLTWWRIRERRADRADAVAAAAARAAYTARSQQIREVA
jgi:predicted lipid-binding transport protein (Tim44 family)